MSLVTASTGITGTVHAELLDTLSGAPARFEASFRGIPPHYIRFRPEDWSAVPGEKFSPAEQACHLRDIEIEGYHVRIRRMLSEHNPDLASIDSYELAQMRRYDRADPEAALADFRAARAQTIAMLGGLTAEQLQRPGTFAEYGRLTLGGLIHLLCSHDLQHLSSMHWLLTKMSGPGLAARS
jgi:hypothetical protein